ncbi:hypothetical protein CGCSCA4_v009991 [Colletotrichum siamense]|nr:hypothetical protein CGCSCA4_v009991 [Colletotrichum siamense]
MGILALRSSYEQKPVIKQLLFDYLDSRYSVGLKSSEGDDFVLEFHLPCVIWQKGQPRREDRGRMINGDCLRKTTDLSFLSMSKEGDQDSGKVPEETDYLYECQTSFIVTGWDTSSWTAICLADSYFEDQTDAEDPYMLPHYVKDPDVPDLDPLSIGKLTADRVAASDPREYFLLIMKNRVMRLREIWTNVDFHLGERINQYLSRPSLLLRRRNTNLGTTDGDSAVVEGSEEWLKRIRTLLNRLMKMLEASVTTLYRFLDRDFARIDALADEMSSIRMNNSFDKISASVEDLEKISERFKNLKSDVDNFASQLGTHIAVDGVRALKLQYLNVTILQVFSPVALAGSIVQAGMVVGNVFVWFLFLTLILTAVTWSLHPIRKWYEERKGSRKQPPVPATAQKLEIDAGIQAAGTGFSAFSCPSLFRKRRTTDSVETLPR